MSDIAADLPNPDKKVEGNLPFSCAEPGLAGKIMEMGDKTLKEVLDTFIIALRVDQNGVFGYVVDVHILNVRRLDVFRIHDCWKTRL